MSKFWTSSYRKHAADGDRGNADIGAAAAVVKPRTCSHNRTLSSSLLVKQEPEGWKTPGTAPGASTASTTPATTTMMTWWTLRGPRWTSPARTTCPPSAQVGTCAGVALRRGPVTACMQLKVVCRHRSRNIPLVLQVLHEKHGDTIKNHQKWALNVVDILIYVHSNVKMTF